MYAEKKMVLILLKFSFLLSWVIFAHSTLCLHPTQCFYLPVIGFPKNLSILFYLNLLGQYVTTIQPCKGYGCLAELEMMAEFVIAELGEIYNASM